LIRKFIGWGLTRNTCLNITGLTKHAYYYKPKGRASAGIKPSEVTLFYNSKTKQWEENPNMDVVNKVVSTLLNPDTSYGYKAMTAHLQHFGYTINHKKVYRLMNEHQLLHDFRKKTPKVYVKYRRVKTNGPLEVMEMDIKLQWITSLDRYAYIFTVIDCFTRKVLYWKAALSIKKEDVKVAWEEIIINYLQPNEMLKKEIKIEVRNDNDKRFEAKIIQDYFKENHLNQVFTHPYTPQENGHIESFHAILARSLDHKYYETLDELNHRLKIFYNTYNKTRLHGTLDHLAPDTFWTLWNQGLITKIERKGKADAFQLNIPHINITGNGSLRELPVPVCAGAKLKTKYPAGIPTTTVQKSPSGRFL
jgi:putative transposase